MITVCRSPLRISLFGGGTDYPVYLERFPGAVLGFAINRYIYLQTMPLPTYSEYGWRLAYSQLERCHSIDEIQHPVVRAVLKEYACLAPMDFSFQADIPAASGLGSSSCFTVGFIRLISYLMKIPRTRLEVAKEAIRIEHDVLGENVGLQDQCHSAVGGFNRFDFFNKSMTITPINVPGSTLQRLCRSLILVHTGRQRRATEVVNEQVKRTAASANDVELNRLYEMVSHGQWMFENTSAEKLAEELGRMLGEAWEVKKRLSNKISDPAIDELYAQCKQHGAIGGKLCGAGGGGFLLMVIPEERRESFIAAIGPSRCVEFDVDYEGASVIYQE